MTDVLEHPVQAYDPEPVDPARPGRGAFDARRVGIVVAIIGAVGMVVGMAVDGVEHALDPTLVQREGLFTLTNIGHALLLLGAGAVVSGLLLALVGPAIYRSGSNEVTAPGRRLVQLAAPLVLLAVFVTVAVWGSNSSLAQGHSHDETVAAGDGHTHAAGPTDVHQRPTTPYQPVDAATQNTFIGEMSRVRALTMQYPTVAAATAAGLRPVGQFSPGSGAHYLVPLDTVMKSLGGFDLDHPIIYLFSGNEPTSTVVGVMYYVMNVPSAPDGFAGPNDVWHIHQGLCLQYTPTGIDLPLPIDGDATAEQCATFPGSMYMDVTGYMVHVWSAPGWESPDGVFAHDNTALTCADGRIAGQVALNEGCQGR
jgi:hypothetical protein